MKIKTRVDAGEWIAALIFIQMTLVHDVVSDVALVLVLEFFLEQMIENDYPVPTYMADVFQYTPKWRETPKPDNPLVAKNGMPVRKIYAIDCEMVRRMSPRV